MRSFEFARKIVNKEVMLNEGKEVKAFENAQIPEYQTKSAAGADFFCAEDVIIPSIWKLALSSITSRTGAKFEKITETIFANMGYVKENEEEKDLVDIVPTFVHTGIKANMEEDEVLEIYNRSSNPKKLGLILANSVGVIDADYYNNKDNDGEIMFAFYNFKLWDVTFKAGDRIGQGVFKKYLRPEIGLRIKETQREGGFGSTDNK